MMELHPVDQRELMDLYRRCMEAWATESGRLAKLQMRLPWTPPSYRVLPGGGLELIPAPPSPEEARFTKLVGEMQLACFRPYLKKVAELRRVPVADLIHELTVQQ